MMNWYMTTYWDDRENDYDLFRFDDEAVKSITANSVGVCEIFRCNDDECLTPAKLLWH